MFPFMFVRDCTAASRKRMDPLQNVGPLKVKCDPEDRMLDMRRVLGQI